MVESSKIITVIDELKQYSLGNVTSDSIVETLNKLADEIEFNFLLDNICVDDYIDFAAIRFDYKLSSGDISPQQELRLENILKDYIKDNR